MPPLSRPTAGDDKNAAPPGGARPHDKAGERPVRLGLRHAMQIEPRFDRQLAAFQPFGGGAIDPGQPVQRRLRWARMRCRRRWFSERGRLARIFSSRLPGRMPALRECRPSSAAARRPASPAATDRDRPGQPAGAASAGSLSSTSTTCSRRGPCAPSWMRCSISPVRDGPVTKLTVRGNPPRARNRSQPSS